MTSDLPQIIQKERLIPPKHLDFSVEIDDVYQILKVNRSDEQVDKLFSPIMYYYHDMMLQHIHNIYHFMDTFRDKQFPQIFWVNNMEQPPRTIHCTTSIESLERILSGIATDDDDDC